MVDCTYVVDDLTLTGDDQYWDRVASQPFVDYVWFGHGFNYDYWQDGWGFDYCNDVTQPLGRALAAFWLLNYAARDPENESYDAPELNWMGRYVREQFSSYDDTRADCGDGTANATTSGCQWTRSYYEYKCEDYRSQSVRTCSSWDWPLSWLCLAWTYIVTGACYLWGWVSTAGCTLYYGTFGGGQNITLFLPYFYTQGLPIVRDVVVRAGTLIHEARHIGNHPHDADFPSGSLYSGQGADSSWEYQGGWTFHAGFMWAFSDDGANSTMAMRSSAKTMGNIILTNCFAKSPGFLIS